MLEQNVIMMQKRILIFDFDGTLVNTGRDYAAAVNFSLKMLKHPQISEEHIISFIGNGIEISLAKCLGPLHKNELDQAIVLFNSFYKDHLVDNTTLYHGIEDILNHFHDKIKVIITNKTCQYTEIISKRLNIYHHFDAIIGADSKPYKKPDSRLIKVIKDEYAATNEEMMVIGDGVNDIIMARNSGVTSCAFLKGFSQKDVLLSLNPTFVYEDPIELKSLIC